MEKNSSPKRTPLYEEHIALHAKMVSFAGWEMPVQYKGIIQEHLTVRSACGIFDVSHMGEIKISGPRALEAVQWLTTNDASRLTPGSSQYSLLCNESGGIIDDLIVSRLSDDSFLLVANASNADRDYAWIGEHALEGSLAENLSDGFAMIALQGPKAEELLARVSDSSLGDIFFFHFRKMKVIGVDAIVSRTGYTGEDGFEILLPPADAPSLWKELLSHGKDFGILPIGLGARDTLRMEMGYTLHGCEISESINPIEAGLGWVVRFEKGVFIGKERLDEQKKRGVGRKLTGFEMTGSGIPRHGYPVFKGEKQVGEITSGTLSPTLKKPIGLGYIEKALAKKDEEVEIGIGGRKVTARVSSLPFVQPHTKKPQP